MHTDSNKITSNETYMVVKQRYAVLGVLNDLLIASWFLAGSFLFLTVSLVETGTWLFVIGSAQMFIRPSIKLTSLIHLDRLYKSKKPE
jgi:hypothetical protein